MKTKQLLAGLLLSCASWMMGQTTVNIRVNASLDDHEERINGSVTQSGTLGNMDAGSSDLELGNEKPTTDPQLVGVRFASVTIPANATIVNAYIQFSVDDIAKNTDPCNLNIFAEDNANPATFSDNPFSLTSRVMTSSSVSWNVTGASWGTVGSATADQRTSDIKSLVQSLVGKSGWASGNAMAFFIKGTGTREVSSFDGSPTTAPELVVTYSLGITGLKEKSATSSVRVYPNPFKASFNVSMEVYTPSEISVSVLDLTGKVVEEKPASQVSSGTFSYSPASALQSGMYFVKVTVNNKSEFIKLIAE